MKREEILHRIAELRDASGWEDNARTLTITDAAGNVLARVGISTARA
jgi:hypothetical protein